MMDKLADRLYRSAYTEEHIRILLRGGASHDHILSSLYTIYNYYKDDYTEEGLADDILMHQEILNEESGIKGRHNIQQEVENLVDFRGNGLITLSDFYTDLKLDTKEDKAACRMAINRLVAKKKIEKIDSGKTGTYRLIKSLAEETRFVKGQRSHFPIKLPFELDKLCHIHPKSIIIIAGSKSSGKTATMLNIAIENQNKLPVVYLNSDMGDEEYTDRMTRMGCTCEEDIKFKTYSRSADFHDLITAEKKIFLIDFLEIHENFFEIGKPIKQIWEKLKDGVAVIAIQMKAGATMARGGDFTKEKARLYLSMDFIASESCSKVTIVDAKAPTSLYPDGVKGWSRKVKIIGGSKFDYQTGWNKYEEPTEKKAAVYGRF